HHLRHQQAPAAPPADHPRLVDLQRHGSGGMRTLHRGQEGAAEEAPHPPLQARRSGRRLSALRHANNRERRLRLLARPYDARWGRAESRVGAGAASADPYLLRKFSKPPTSISWRRRERTAGCESVWSAEAAPAPPGVT